MSEQERRYEDDGLAEGPRRPDDFTFPPSRPRQAPDPVAALREEVAGVLAGHAYRSNLLRGIEECACGESTVGEPGWHARHQADALLAHLAPLVEARERVEALADEWDDYCGDRDYVWDNGYESAMHRAAEQLRAANVLTPTEERP